MPNVGSGPHPLVQKGDPGFHTLWQPQLGKGAASHGLTNLRLTLETPFSGWTVLEALPRVSLQSPQQAGFSLRTLTLSVPGAPGQVQGVAPGLHSARLAPPRLCRYVQVTAPSHSSSPSSGERSPDVHSHPPPDPQSVHPRVSGGGSSHRKVTSFHHPMGPWQEMGPKSPLTCGLASLSCF